MTKSRCFDYNKAYGLSDREAAFSMTKSRCFDYNKAYGLSDRAAASV